MNKRHFLAALFASGGALAVGSALNAGGLRLRWTEPPLRSSLLLASAGSMTNLCKALKKRYENKNPLTDIVIEHGDSLQGIIAVKRGAIDVAAISRDLTSEEDDQDSHSYLIARSNIFIIVHPQSPLRNLTQAQVRDVFTGTIANWRQLGGSDAPIQLVSRMRGSNTRQFMEEVVLGQNEIGSNALELETTRQVAARVAEDINAIGYIAAKNDAGDSVTRALTIDGIEASEATVLSGRYPYTSSFYLLLAGETLGPKIDFIKFARSAEGQTIVSEQGFVPVC
jgi:phosphate transport system substrate-binding protein